MISISSVYPRPATRAASFPNKTTENRPQNNPHFGRGQETYRTTFIRTLKGASAIVAGQYGVPLVTDNSIISRAVTAAGLGMLGWSGLKLAKKLTLDVRKSIAKLLRKDAEHGATDVDARRAYRAHRAFWAEENKGVYEALRRYERCEHHNRY